MNTRHFTYIILFFSVFSVNAQIGVGTVAPDPSAILDINSTTQGVLFPRMNNADKGNINNPATGLIIFNTDTSNLEINHGTTSVPIWNTFTNSVINSSVKYSNTNTTTNINSATFQDIPIYGTAEWNDNATIFVPVDPNSIRVMQTGRYRIVANIAVASSSNNARMAIEAQLAINGINTGTIAATAYMRRSGNNHDHSSLHINETLHLTANSLITIKTRREANNGTVTMRSAATSNIMIELIK